MIRYLSMAGFLLFVASVGFAQDQARRPKGPPGADRIGGGPVMPSELAEKLGLSAEQKDKIAKLQAESDKQNEEARARMKDAIQNKDREKMRAAGEALGKARQDLEAKVKEVLTEEQRKKFDEQRRERRPGFPGAPGRFGGGPPFGVPQPGVVLPVPVQERLQLTAEQKEKLAQLQKDVDAKLNSILTEEQKKQLKQPPGGERRRRPPQNQ